MIKYLYKNPFLIVTLVSYLTSFFISVFAIQYDSGSGLLVFLLMICTAIVRFAIVHNIISLVIDGDIGEWILYIEFFVSVLVSIFFDALLRISIKKWRNR